MGAGEGSCAAVLCCGPPVRCKLALPSASRLALPPLSEASAPLPRPPPLQLASPDPSHPLDPLPLSTGQASATITPLVPGGTQRSTEPISSAPRRQLPPCRPALHRCVQHSRAGRAACMWASAVLLSCDSPACLAVLFIKVTVARNWNYHLLNTILPVRRSHRACPPACSGSLQASSLHA